MKTLSLWQPWAIFIPEGLKKYETRSWPTPYRGELAIHAAKLQRSDLKEYLEDLKMFEEFDQFVYEELPFGAVLAVCNLRHVYRVEDCVNYLGEIEVAVGDYTQGRFAWELEVVKVFDPPVPAAGKQGLWDWTPEGVKLS